MTRPAYDPNLDSRNASTELSVPAVVPPKYASGITIREKSDDTLQALVEAIDRAFLAGARVDLTLTPMIALTVLDDPAVGDAHWAAYGREAGLLKAPDAALQARVRAFYRNGRQ